MARYDRDAGSEGAHPQLQEALGRIAQLEATLTTTCTTLARVTAERDKLHRAYEQLKEQLELLRRRIYIAKAERIDARQLERNPSTRDVGSATAITVPSGRPRPSRTLGAIELAQIDQDAAR